MPRAPRNQKDLIELYRIAVEEYRFEVKLNWHRMQYYSVVNSGIIAIAAGLLYDTSSRPVFLLSGTIFLMGLMMATMGIVAIHKGRQYYRETIFKKTIYEEILGLNNRLTSIDHPRANLAIGTTSGQQKIDEILAGRAPEKFLNRLFENKVVTYFTWLLIFLALVDIAGVSYTAWRTLNPPSAPTEPSPPHVTIIAPGVTTIHRGDGGNQDRIGEFQPSGVESEPNRDTAEPE